MTSAIIACPAGGYLFVGNEYFLNLIASLNGTFHELVAECVGVSSLSGTAR